MNKSNQIQKWKIYNCLFEHGDLCKHEWINKNIKHIIVYKFKKYNHKKNIVLDEPCKPSNTHCRNHILNLTAEADDQI
jgi:hypothetical protein